LRCGNVSFRNPVPVTVVLIPIDDGVLTVRRDIEPGRGQLALPGGYVNAGETWQAAGAREVYEETGLRLDPAELKVIDVYSTPHDQVLIFARACPRARQDLPAFTPNAEVSELVVLHNVQLLAFDSHTRMLRRFLAGEPAESA
jgi:ADP-ribose pyrophosphatase YjhB (NUDIX family)